MRPIFTQVIFTRESLILFSNSQRLPEPILIAKNRELQTQCNSRTLRSTLMLGCTCRIHLGYNGQGSDVPELMLNINMEGSRDNAQHFQFIFSCVPELHAQHKYNTHVLQSFLLNTKINHSRAPDLLSQHKTSHQSCASGSTPNTKHFISHVLQVPCPTQNIYIHIYHQQLAYTQYTKQIIMFICSGVFDPI